MIRPLALMLCLTGDAQAQQMPTCMSYDQMTTLLADNWHEVPMARAIERRGAGVEIYANPVTGSWTLITILPGGMSCLMASGQAFTVLQAALGVPS